MENVSILNVNDVLKNNHYPSIAFENARVDHTTLGETFKTKLKNERSYNYIPKNKKRYQTVWYNKHSNKIKQKCKKNYRWLGNDQKNSRNKKSF